MGLIPLGSETSSPNVLGAMKEMKPTASLRQQLTSPALDVVLCGLAA